ncbi:hypothetical protein F6R98_21030 [Candidatus Methylospira mobilis]|uniref:Uncharacterized protein n=1 Tax=Candidatus Methylospira mobilis TaxID=1808979 RepID=A0A5Q0BT10_9GAMM|nr:hypothetical protein [Candidatus Methylospira mobilis]QFY44806.1 hypothetical protein F6R98_21030 [Candidatus Methylospira mobilis]WNV05650.1 hypothetical protein RP726_04320 [Candidatus Methylospira mobilis]
MRTLQGEVWRTYPDGTKKLIYKPQKQKQVWPTGELDPPIPPGHFVIVNNCGWSMEKLTSMLASALVEGQFPTEIKPRKKRTKTEFRPDPLIDFCLPRPNCDPVVAAAISKFTKNVDDRPSLSLNMKNRSVWTFLRRDIDGAVRSYLSQLADLFYSDSTLSQEAKRCFAKTGNLISIEGEFRACIRALHLTGQYESMRSEVEPIIATLESLLCLLESLISRKQPGNSGAIDELPLHNNEHYPFCEMCWRLSAHAENENNQKENKNDTYNSRRFCRDHDYGNFSQQNGIARKKLKERFQSTLIQSYSILSCFPGVDIEADKVIRRFAYDYAHAPSLKELDIQILRMQREGLSQQKIADTLNIRHKKSVSDRIKKCRRYFKESIVANLSKLSTKSSARKWV